MNSLLSPIARKLILGGALVLAALPAARALDLRSRIQPDGGPNEFVWISPTTGNWSNGANWLGGIAPPAGGGSGLVLRFTGVGPSGGYRVVNDLPGVFDLAGLVLDNRRGSLNVLTGIVPIITTNTSALSLRMGEGAFLEQRGAGDAVVALSTQLDGAVTVRGSQFGALSLYSALSGAGSLRIDRADGGAVLLGATDAAFPLNNTFSGGVELRNGVLLLQRNTALGTGPLTITGGILGSSSPSSFNPPPLGAVPNAIQLQADLRWGGTAKAALSGPISGAGGLRVEVQPPTGQTLAERTLSLQGVSTFTGATRVEARNGLAVNGVNGALLGTSGVTLLPVSQLEIDHRGDASGPLNRLGDAVPVTLHGATLNLIGASAVPTVEAMGVLRGGSGLSAVNLQSATGAVADPATVLIPASFSAAGSGGVVRFSGRQLGSAAPGTAGVDSVLFADTVGTLAQLVGGGGAAGAAQVSILPGALGVLSAGQRDPASPAGTSFVTYDPVAGVRPLRMDTEYVRSITSGTATQNNVFLTSTATINADTTVNSILQGQNGTITGTGTLRLASGMMVARGLTNVAVLDFGAQPGRIIVDSNLGNGFPSGGATIESVIAGSGGITILGELYGSSIITLRGVNTFTGPLTIGADVRAGVASLGGTGAIRLDAGTLTLDSGGTLARDVFVGEGGGSLNGNITLTGRLSGAGNISFGNSPGQVATLAGSGASFSGGLTVFTTTLQFSEASQLGTPREIVLSGGRLVALGAAVLDAPVRVNGAAISGSSAIETRADVTLTRGISGNDVVSRADVNSGLGTFTKLGSAVLRVQGDSSYQGAITVQEGTMIMNGSVAHLYQAGTGLTVAAGARLGGNGLIHRDVSLMGSVAPGDFAPGILTLDGDLVVGTAAAFEWDRSAGGSDLLTVNGRVTFSGGTFTLRLRALDGALPSGADVLLQAGEGIGGTPAFVLDFTDAPAWATLGLHAEIVNGSLVLVPEPGSWAAALVLGGGALFIGARRRARAARDRNDLRNLAG